MKRASRRCFNHSEGAALCALIAEKAGTNFELKLEVSEAKITSCANTAAGLKIKAIEIRVAEIEDALAEVRLQAS
jgi:hypothetical protein